MDRLTERDEYGNADIIGVDSEALQLNLEFDEFNLVTDALNRLAAYEDTGLEPEEIKQVQVALDKIPFGRFCEIMQAEREDRCVVLPCKVGDTVYIRRYSLAQKQNTIIEAHVAAVKVFRTGFQIDCVTHNGAVNKCEWGRQCFATRAEAEEALKGAKT